MEKKSFIRELLGNGDISHKRVIALTCLLLLVVGYVANLFFGFAVDKTFLTVVETVLLVTMGASAVQGIAKKLKISQDDNKGS